MQSHWIFLSIFLYRVIVSQFVPRSECFCKTLEAVDHCRCDDESIDEFNNRKVFSILQKLLLKDFFRFYKVDLEKPCPFWPDDRQCASRECGIGYCDDEVPKGLKESPRSVLVVRFPRNATSFRRDELSMKPSENCDEVGNIFDPLDKTLSAGHEEQLRHMDWHDDSEDKFCDFDDDSSNNLHYVDLSKNPERYTGYKGNNAQKVWSCIYQENCFKPNMKFDKNFLLNPSLVAPTGFGEGTWFRNAKMFNDRFGTKWSSEGPERLKNIYFVYLLELRALVKAAPYLKKELFYTGNEKDDTETRAIVEKLVDTFKQFPHQFDETEMFTGNEAQARELKEEFRMHFLNISRIMDCVGCDKCRLWGKLQTHGMGTALKILFSDLPTSHYRGPDGALHAPFQLTRNEVVSLFQSFGRYSSSIKEIDEFRRLLKE